MTHRYPTSLVKLLILVMVLLPLQSMAVSVTMSAWGAMPCSVMTNMANMTTEQNKMDMDKPCQMDMPAAQFCANCDYSSVAVFLLSPLNISFSTNSQPVSRLSIQFTNSSSPPPIRPPIRSSII